MANRRRRFPKDAAFREIERAELTMTIRTLRLQPFIFVLFCAVLTIGMQRWFNRNNRLNTFWYWALVVAAALMTFVTEYERLLLQDFENRW
ncbi:hypothetical protein RHGRI_033521 [Rhododendron griersonianum]|uniref:Uncharacterized protein n=1 Tax=Rhododendron griersonianum TaxID=479676 RepID=A0AAV6HXJ5_9ERIC|nr:hypothetical protein RHGRI_033521 [Rhododendron griersonianum]